MKKYILLGALGAAGIATGLAVIGSQSIALYFGLLSVTTFFVGWAYPVSTTITDVMAADGTQTTRKVVNN